MHQRIAIYVSSCEVFGLATADGAESIEDLVDMLELRITTTIYVPKIEPVAFAVAYQAAGVASNSLGPRLLFQNKWYPGQPQWLCATIWRTARMGQLLVIRAGEYTRDSLLVVFGTPGNRQVRGSLGSCTRRLG